MTSELYYFKLYKNTKVCLFDDFYETDVEVLYESMYLNFDDIVDILRTFIKVNNFNDTMWIDLFDNNDKCILSIDADFLMQLHLNLED